MRKLFFRKLLIAMGLTLGGCWLLYPLLLPTENYFRLLLQILPVAVFVGLLLLLPLYVLSVQVSRHIAERLKTLKLDSRQVLAEYPELRPVSRQIMSFRTQMEAQKNELEGQQEQLRVLTDNMQEGLLLVSATGRVLSHNHAALQLLDKESFSGDFGVFELSSSPEFHRLVNNALEGIRGSAVITVNDTACQLFANPVTRGSMMTGAVLVLMNVTEREKRDALRREFTSNVSHELKTPLTSIYGIADMMESGLVKAEDISGFAKKVRDESSRLIALIEDIIRLSRLDDDSFSEEVLPIDLYEVAETICGQLLPQAEEKHIEMVLEGGSAKMKGVPVIVEEMLYNLCDNAIKCNKENGYVHMKVTCTEQSAIFIVTDSGIGIPLADRERIFERFYRVDKSHSKQIGGTGLGLSIVKHGAQFHNAKIELESQLDVGTTITLFFPRSVESAALAERDALLNPLDIEVSGSTANGETVRVNVRAEAEQRAASAQTAEDDNQFTFEIESDEESAAGPVTETAEPETEPVTETAEPETEPVTETAEPETEPVAEIAEPETEPVTETAEPEIEPVAETAEPKTEPVAETAEPETEPVTEAAEPASETAAESPAETKLLKKPAKRNRKAKESAAEQKPVQRRNILDRNTDDLMAELEREIENISLQIAEQSADEETYEDIPEEISAAKPAEDPPAEFSFEDDAEPDESGRFPFDPDLVPIDETTMDIKL